MKENEESIAASNLFGLHTEDALGWLPLRENGVGNGDRPDGRRESSGGPARAIDEGRVGAVVGVGVGGVAELGVITV